MPGIFGVVVIWAICVVAGSALLHELGHAWTARAVGWKVVDLRLSWYGVALIADPNGKPEQTWKVALGGLVATGVLALGFLAGTVLPEPVSVLFRLGFAFNAVILLTNLVPVRWFDGGQILGGIRESRELGSRPRSSLVHTARARAPRS
jgi:Zn-dependent protease